MQDDDDKNTCKSIRSIFRFSRWWIVNNLLKFNEKFSFQGEIHSILVYIGLITVILFLLGVIYSLICKCLKMFDDEKIPTKKKSKGILCWTEISFFFSHLVQPQAKRYRTNSLTSRQTILSSASSSPLLTSYRTNKSLTKPSSARILRCQRRSLLPIIHVWKYSSFVLEIF